MPACCPQWGSPGHSGRFVGEGSAEGLRCLRIPLWRGRGSGTGTQSVPGISPGSKASVLPRIRTSADVSVRYTHSTQCHTREINCLLILFSKILYI